MIAAGGTLQVGNAGTTGTLGTGPVVDNGRLFFNRPDTTTVPNTISGTGVVRLITGTVILTGASIYSGITQIDAGTTLQIGSGGTTGSLGTGNVIDRGTLVFNRSDDVNVANSISQTWSVTQAGTGTTTLTANSLYSGITTVTAGFLEPAGVRPVPSTAAGRRVGRVSGRRLTRHSRRSVWCRTRFANGHSA